MTKPLPLTKTSPRPMPRFDVPVCANSDTRRDALHDAIVIALPGKPMRRARFWLLAVRSVANALIGAGGIPDGREVDPFCPRDNDLGVSMIAAAHVPGLDSSDRGTNLGTTLI